MTQVIPYTEMLELVCAAAQARGYLCIGSTVERKIGQRLDAALEAAISTSRIVYDSDMGRARTREEQDGKR